MDQRLRESISALMDDESNELELQRIMSHSDSEEVRAVWARYHEVRQVINQDNESHFNIDISAGVAAAIRDEAPIESDENDSIQVATASQKVVSIQGKKDVPESDSERNLGGRAWLALAASVAFAFIFALQGNDKDISDQVPTVASSVSSDTSLVKVGIVDEPKVIVEMTEDQARHFGKYLLRHAEHSVRGTQSGFMPLARVASVNSVGI